MLASQVLIRARQLQNQNKSWRWGQSLFNALDELRPEIADKIGGTESDPFYCKENIDNFWRSLRSYS